ncbi:heme o synthase [Paraliomyxa miuraensis]|uniref:heme o synthase n=1 Tax=Paraliomyxa miuraensis TaxID=376150 RepID=UPI0022539BF1|nr:heme o synthase [Paraliomyxa miuraensis]MCX4239865.1 heme o synthase [Paraliomyxa miuraensis]
MARANDLWALTKPGVTRMCVLTTAGGLVLAPGSIGWSSSIAVVIGSALAVGGANAANMWWERDSDALMSRTRRRPLPAGRLSPSVALGFAVLMSLLSVIVLGVFANALAAGLATFAILSYVFVYTPLKRRTPLALVIGAIPGAVPPLLGWTAVTDALDPGGLVLFGILLVWQIPHFIAIALYRKAEYARAGIRVVPLVRGDAVAKIQAVAWAGALVPLSLMLTPLGVAGFFYLAAAMILGMGFLGWAFTGLDDHAGARWARGYFLASLVYLPALTAVLAIDVALLS